VQPLDLATADRLLAAAGLGSRARSVETLKRGAASSVVAVRSAGGRDTVVKLYAERPAWKMEKEVRVYHALAGPIERVLPRILAADASRTAVQHRYVLMSRLPGRPLLDVLDRLDERQRAGVYRELGGLLRELHEPPAEAFGYIGRLGVRRPHATNLAYVRERFEERLREHARLGGDAAVRRRIERAVTAGEELLARCVRPALCHNDCHEENVLVARGRAGWRVCGLVDFANAVGADPLFDLAGAYCYSRAPSRSSAAALLDGYGPLPDGWRETLRLYALYHRLDLWVWRRAAERRRALPALLPTAALQRA